MRKGTNRLRRPSESCPIGLVWWEPVIPNRPTWALQNWISFSGNLVPYSIWRCSTGDRSYGNWSAECWEYLASLSWPCLLMDPSVGCRAPVIKLSRVDLPVPLSPTIAILTISSVSRERRSQLTWSPCRYRQTIPCIGNPPSFQSKRKRHPKKR